MDAFLGGGVILPVPISLNALTGIDGIWTQKPPSRRSRPERLNALTGIDGIWTWRILAPDQPLPLCLNALTGIDGIWTKNYRIAGSVDGEVLMPLRALMGFGLRAFRTASRCPGES